MSLNPHASDSPNQLLRVPPPELEPISRPVFAAKNEDWYRLRLFPDYCVSNHGRVGRLTASRGTKPGILQPQARLVFRKGKAPMWGLFVSLYANGKRYGRNLAWLLGNIQAVQKRHRSSANRFPARTADLSPRDREALHNMHQVAIESGLNEEGALRMALPFCAIRRFPETRLRREIGEWFKDVASL